MRGSETERENEVNMAFCAKGEVRALGLQKGGGSLQDEKSRC